MFHQQLDNPADAHLFFIVELAKPSGEVVGALDIPGHGQLCHSRNNASRVIAGAEVPGVTFEARGQVAIK
jgi:hypothetical protein